MPLVDIRYSLGLTTLKSQSIQFKAAGQLREIVIPAGKVISQQLIDVIRRVEPEFQVAVQPVLGLQEIVHNTKLHVENAKSEAAPAMMQLPYDKDTILFEQGDRSDEIYLLNEGSVAVWVDGVHVSTIDERGTYIGELSVLTGLSRSATIKTLEPCKFSVIPGARLEAAVQQTPSVGYKLAILLAQRLKKTNEKAASASRRATVAEKLVLALGEDLNGFLSRAKEPAIAEIARTMKHREILGEDGLVYPASILAKAGAEGRPIRK